MQYSKFDGFNSVKDLVRSAKKSGHRAVGLTDHGTFAGAVDFLATCRNEGIKPILGMEAYMSRYYLGKDKESQPDKRRGNRHVNIFAKNYQGYKNLCTLSQESSLNGYYYDPRIDFDLLSKHREGLIVTSACLSNVVNWNLSIDRYDKAKKAAAAFKDIFGEDYYLEIMYHGIDTEAKVLPLIQKLAKELDIKMIATNDCHYPTKGDAEYHEVLMCMSSGRCIKDPKHIKFPYSEFYFKSTEEMSQVFGHIHTAMTNTLEIMDKCDYSDIIFVEDGGEMRLPHFDLPEGFTSPHDYLEHMAWEGLKNLGLGDSKEHIKHLRQELSDVRLIWDTKRYDFATYFLIVEDIMKFARENDIPSGIRGSGYGSVLLKCLGISEGVDPLEFDLMWERFLGFDWKMFLCEDDFGIKEDQIHDKNTENQGPDDATNRMFERYS